MADITIKDFQNLKSVLVNNGLTLDGTRMKLKDALSVPNAPVLFPKVISNIVREAAEPLLVGTSLLQRINYKYGQTITFGATGAMHAADIPEGGEYPTRSLTGGGGTVTATIGKSGLAVQINEEVIRYSQYDVLGIHLRAAGRALARWKEQKIFNMISHLGVKIFDNVTPTASIRGVTTGRDMSGAGNGSVVVDDIFDAFGQVILQGFMPDTLLLHPLCWTIWMKDPYLRAFALAAGRGPWFGTSTGNALNKTPWEAASQGGMGISTGRNTIPGDNTAGLAATELESYSQTLTSAPTVPSLFPFPLRVIVSPMIPYDPRRLLTDIYVCDSAEIGYLIVDEDVTTEAFNDPSVDIQKVKIRERYALAMASEGHGVGVIKNVHLKPNEVVLPVQTTLDVSGSTLGPLSPTASVL